MLPEVNPSCRLSLQLDLVYYMGACTKFRMHNCDNEMAAIG